MSFFRVLAIFHFSCHQKAYGIGRGKAGRQELPLCTAMSVPVAIFFVQVANELRWWVSGSIDHKSRFLLLFGRPAGVDRQEMFFRKHAK